VSHSKSLFGFGTLLLLATSCTTELPTEPPALPVVPVVPPVLSDQVGSLAIDALIDQFASTSEARDRAVDELVAQGSSAVSALSAAAAHDDWRISAGASFTLSLIGSEASAAMDALQAAQKHDDERIRDPALWAADAIEG